MKGRVVFAVFAWLGTVTSIACAAELTSPVQVMLIAPTAFQPTNHLTEYVVEQGGLGQLCVLKGSSYFVAPLQLERGVTIEALTVYLQDSSKDCLGMMSLIRTRPLAFEVLATTPVSTGTGKLESLAGGSITSPVVEEGWSYVLQVVLSGPGVCLHGAQVTYKAP